MRTVTTTKTAETVFTEGSCHQAQRTGCPGEHHKSHYQTFHVGPNPGRARRRVPASGMLGFVGYGHEPCRCVNSWRGLRRGAGYFLLLLPIPAVTAGLAGAIHGDAPAAANLFLIAY